MKTRMLSLSLLVSVVMALTVFGQGTNQRVYVSELNGDDTNSCSLTSSCKTLAQALSTVASGGEIVVLDSGAYGSSGLSITKAVTITAPLGVYAGLAGTITVGAGSSDVVTLRGLYLSSDDAGVLYNTGGTLRVENCVITNFYTYGIKAVAPSGKLFVKDSEIRGLTSNYDGAGLWLQPSSGTLSVYVDRTRLENNFLVGIWVDDNVNGSMRDTIVSGSDSGVWVVSANTASKFLLDRCQVTGNNGGIRSDGLGTAYVVNSAIVRNYDALSGASTNSLRNRNDSTNTLQGNSGTPAFTSTYTKQ